MAERASGDSIQKYHWRTARFVTVHGGMVDPAYTRLLMQKTDLPFKDILALDRVQKHLPLSDATMKRLGRAGLIEGRKPNLHVSALVAKATASKAEYIHRAQDDAFYPKLLTDYLNKFGKASRQEILKLLLNKLNDALDAEQKANKIKNLIRSGGAPDTSENTGSRKAPEWRLANKVQN